MSGACLRVVAFLTPWVGMVTLLGACGTVTLKIPADAADSQTLADAVADVPTNVTPDTVTADTGSAEVAGSCGNDVDCLQMKGKTPCKVPTCVANVCTLVLRKVSEKCDNPLDPASECEESACTAEGQCEKHAKKDATVCGNFKCGNLCKAGQCVVATPADYDDGQPCTNDFCDQGDEVKHVPITDLGKACEDGNKCTTGDACVEGVCKGQATNCDDGIACTTDDCQKASGCTHIGAGSKCDDSNPCTKDTCDSVAGCTFSNELAKTCDDGNPCSLDTICLAGKCAGGKPEPACLCTTDAQCAKFTTASMCAGKMSCDPAHKGTTTKFCDIEPGTAVVCGTEGNSACTKNACDPATGVCIPQKLKDGVECDDGDACSAKTSCAKGACTMTAALACDDKIACTTDSCDPVLGCLFTANADACNDANACTSGDTCASGACKGIGKACDDVAGCTIDQCDPATGDCSHKPDDAQCDDANPCTLDTCEAGTGCVHNADLSAKCSDDNDCTADVCKAGKCTSTVTCTCQAAADCNDNNPCTIDACAGGQCANTAMDAGACDTGNKCSVANSGTCTAGICTGGQPLDCSAAGDACNTATCNPSTGKCEAVSKGNGTPCDADKSGCTGPDVCQGGKCVGGPAVTCPGGDACNTMVCQSTGATSHTCATKPKGPGTPCEDGKYCTQGDQCDMNGKCVAGQAPACQAAGPCLDSSCDEATKQCAQIAKPKGSSCEDGKFCTSLDYCDNGACLSGQPMLCKNAGPCGVGKCDEPTNQCVQVFTAGCCMTSAECNDGQPCTADKCSASGTNPGTCANPVDTTCSQPVIYSATFDKGMNGGMILWNSSGSPSWGWQFRPESPQVQSPPGVLYYGDVKGNNFAFGGTASNGTASTPWIKLATSGAPLLTFMLYMDTESSPNFDQLNATLIFENSPTKSQILWTKDVTSPVNQKQWNKITLPLLDIPASSPFRIEFQFNTVDGVANETFGVAIDDLQISWK